MIVQFVLRFFFFFFFFSINFTLFIFRNYSISSSLNSLWTRKSWIRKPVRSNKAFENPETFYPNEGVHFFFFRRLLNNKGERMVAGRVNVNSNEYSRGEMQSWGSRGILGSFESHVDRYRLMKLLLPAAFSIWRLPEDFIACT